MSRIFKLCDVIYFLMPSVPSQPCTCRRDAARASAGRVPAGAPRSRAGGYDGYRGNRGYCDNAARLRGRRAYGG